MKSHSATAPETVSLSRTVCGATIDVDDGTVNLVSLAVDVLDEDADRAEGNENGPTLMTLPLVEVVVDALSPAAEVAEASLRNVKRAAPLDFLVLSSCRRSTQMNCISVSSYQTLIS